MNDQNTILESYKIAITMYNDEGAAVWGRFNNYLLANSIIILTIGTLMVGNHNKNNLQDLIIFLEIIGMIVCLFWGIAIIHGVMMTRLWPFLKLGKAA